MRDKEMRDSLNSKPKEKNFSYYVLFYGYISKLFGQFVWICVRLLIHCGYTCSPIFGHLCGPRLIAHECLWSLMLPQVSASYCYSTVVCSLLRPAHSLAGGRSLRTEHTHSLVYRDTKVIMRVLHGHVFVNVQQLYSTV